MKPNHTDERGAITDLLVTDDLAVTDITFTVGAIRGNHFHEETLQIDRVIEGKLLVKTDTYEHEVSAGDTLTHYPGTPHAYKAILPSRIISICFGVRKGEDYSKDTYKLETPLL